MGCCETRPQNETKPLESRFTFLEEEENFDFILKYGSSFSDIKAKEIEIYVGSLLNSSNWITHIETQDHTLKTKIGSMFNESSPVSMIVLDLNYSVALHKVLNLIFSPESRLEWDFTLEFMELLKKPENTVRIIKKYPFKPLELVLKVNCIKEKNMAIALYYSEEYEFVDSNVQRSQCYFGMVKIMKTKNSTVVILIQQEDFDKGTGSERANLMASELFQWMLVFKKKLSERV